MAEDQDHMKLKKIRLSNDICITYINNIANEKDMKVHVESKKDHTILRISEDNKSEGIIRIYATKSKGQTLDGSVGNTEINDLILSTFEERHCQGGDSRIESKVATYNVKNNDFDEIKDVIEISANKHSYVVKEKVTPPPHAYYSIEVSHSEIHDKVTITQYNSGKLMIQGKSWEVWDDICNDIEEFLNISVEDIVLRMLSKEGTTITNVITNTLQSDGQAKISERMGRAFNFLYDHDQNLITSSQCMLLAEVNYGDYYCYVAPCLRVIEGYLKKVIVELGFYTETEIEELNHNGKPKFHFGWVYNGTSALQQDIKKQLINDPENKKEDALLKVYNVYTNTRNPLQHDGPPVQRTITSYDEAESYFDQIVGVISSTYNELF